MPEREAWIVVVQNDHEEETEVVTLEGVTATPGATIEGTDGQRITFVEPAGVEAARQAA